MPCSQFQCFPASAWIRNYLTALQREVGRSRWEEAVGVWSLVIKRVVMKTRLSQGGT